MLQPVCDSRTGPLCKAGRVFAGVIDDALANGIVAYFFGDTSYQYALSGTNIILVAFIHIYTHLQHTHIWIAFRGVFGCFRLQHRVPTATAGGRCQTGASGTAPPSRIAR